MVYHAKVIGPGGRVYQCEHNHRTETAAINCARSSRTREMAAMVWQRGLCGKPKQPSWPDNGVKRRQPPKLAGQRIERLPRLAGQRLGRLLNKLGLTSARPSLRRCPRSGLGSE